MQRMRTPNERLRDGVLVDIFGIATSAAQVKAIVETVKKSLTPYEIGVMLYGDHITVTHHVSALVPPGTAVKAHLR
jgi:hypothetical protein